MNGPRPGIVWTDELWSYDGKVIRQEIPDPWKYLRGGRGYGKGSYARKMLELQEQVQRVIDKTDELHKLAAGWRITPPAHTFPEIEDFTWGCYPPTDMPAVGTPLWHARQATKFLAGWSPPPRKAPPETPGDVLDLIIDAKNAARSAAL